MTSARPLLVALLAVLCLAAPAAPAAALPAGFEDEPLVTGLTQPVSAAFVPDGRMLVLEKPGRVKVVAPGGDTATQILSIEEQTNAWHDRGALGIAVDGQFPAQPYVYVLYTYELNPLNPDQNGPMVGRLLRYRLTAGNQLLNPTPLLGTYTSGPCPAAQNTLDCIPSDSDTHSIGTIRAAPDGTLFVGAGDGAFYNAPDPNAVRTFDEQSLSGKILHIDREGRGLPGHPYCAADDDLTHACTKVFAKGFRNPFRFSLAPDGGLNVGDVGWGSTEELDLIPPGGGRSYGWPCLEGPNRTGGYRDYDVCKAIYAENAQTNPDRSWPHAGSDSAAMGGPTYTGASYPDTYRGAVFHGDYAKGWLDWRDPATGQSTRFRDDNFGVVELTSDPNGDLVQVSVGDFSDGAGSVTATRYCPGTDCPPVPFLSATPKAGPSPLTVAFDARASRDPEGRPLTYSWDFGDGAQGSGAQVTHQFAGGVFTVRLTVSDGSQSRSTTTTVSSGNTPPQPTVTVPPTFRAGEPVALRGAATDTQDGPLTGAALTWRVVLVHGGHTHPLGDLQGTAPTFTPLTDHDADSHYIVTLTARDSGGLTASASGRSDPETVPLTIRSEPPGAAVDYAGVAVPSPFSAPAAIGFQTSVTAAEALESGGQPYTFAGWSDGGERTHAVTIPAAPLELVARYAPVGGPPPDGGSGTPAPPPEPTAAPGDPSPGPGPGPDPGPGDDDDPDAQAPTAYLDTGVVRVDGRRRGPVFFTCKFFAGDRCRGRAELRLGGKVIARKAFRARVDRSKRVVLRLDRRRYRQLRRAGKLRVVLVVRLRGAEPARTRLTLRQIKP